MLSQGHLPGLTHMGIVETPRHEPPLCPVPPRAGGVTTVAPGERDSSSSTSNLFKSIPAFPRISRPRDSKASGQEGAKSTDASKPQSGDASLPGPRSASAARSGRSHTTWRPTSPPCSRQLQKPQAKGLCLKTKALGLLKDSSFGLGSRQLCMGKHRYVLALSPPAIIIHYSWGQDAAQRDFQSMQSPSCSHLTPASTAQTAGGASCSLGRLGRQG